MPSVKIALAVKGGERMAATEGVGLAHPSAPAALLGETQADGSVVCRLCAHRCRVRPGLQGICGVRRNVDGRLATLVADRIVAADVDPIEKKPFFHFLPGTLSYSIATVGCNLHCLFCQNWSISQWPRTGSGVIPGQPATPRAIVATALAARCATIAYTYTEPTIFFELALATSRLAGEAGIRNVFVTNGYMTEEALALVAPTLHGANVDLKSFSDRFYRKVCGATLAPVLATIERMRARSIWVEVTTLVIPGRNDSDEELGALARWLASVDRDMPWHVSAFRPAYRLIDAPSTPAATLHRAARLGREAGLRYVYAGNVPGDPLENTGCPTCGRGLVRRHGFRVVENHLSNGCCPVCRQAIAGVWA